MSKADLHKTKISAASTRSHSPLISYIWLAGGVVILAAISNGYGDQILHRLAALEDAPTAPVLAAFSLFALCGFVSCYAALGTSLPSFVVAIALGIAGHRLFTPIVANTTVLTSLVTGSAAIILFGGGLEMPLRAFGRLFVKIALLAFPGVLLTGFAFSVVVGSTGSAFGSPITLPVVVLLGAILASTDPAAIIPVLQNVRFRRRETKDIVVAESALNDVVGTLLTSVFLKLSLLGLTILAAYKSLATSTTLYFLATQVGFGVLFGFLGFTLLWFLNRTKRQYPPHYGADQFYFLAVPVMSFAAAAAFGGSGFLAAFLAGLLFHGEEHMEGIERFFAQVIDGAAKPIIFLLVGALVDVRALIAFAPVGIASGLIFMFVIRPTMVFLMLGAYGFQGNSRGRLSIRELLFISFVRETGAIPAVLLVTAVAQMTPPVNGLVEIGMWVILLTLVIAPPLTPYIARKLGVAD